MSSNNFLSVEPSKDGKWEVWIKDADSGKGYPDGGEFETRDEAIDYAQKIQGREVIEYGIQVAALPLTKKELKIYGR